MWGFLLVILRISETCITLNPSKQHHYEEEVSIVSAHFIILSKKEPPWAVWLSVCLSYTLFSILHALTSSCSQSHSGQFCCHAVEILSHSLLDKRIRSHTQSHNANWCKSDDFPSENRILHFLLLSIKINTFRKWLFPSGLSIPMAFENNEI